MRETRLSGSEGGAFEFNRLSLPLSFDWVAHTWIVCMRDRRFHLRLMIFGPFGTLLLCQELPKGTLVG